MSISPNVPFKRELVDALTGVGAVTEIPIFRGRCLTHICDGIRTYDHGHSRRAYHGAVRGVMGDYPIIFSGPMVRALLAGRKTQARRLATSRLARCQPNDRLWVRESFALASGPDGGRAKWPNADYVLFKDGAIRFRDGQARQVDRERAYRRAGWWPAFLMRRWASRLTLTVEAVRIEPLNALDRADAVREGPRGLPFAAGPLWVWAGLPGLPSLSPIDAVRSSWEKVRGTPGERWEDNPDVVVLTFHVEERNIDEG